MTSGFSEKSMIYKLLRHHYILRKSVVVIEDQKFSNVFYYKLAQQVVRNIMNSLEPEDSFGYIRLTSSMTDNIPLEPKSRNQTVKETFLNQQRKPRFLGSMKKRKVIGEVKSKRLETALYMALDWQRQLQNHKVTVKGRSYTGPHKWIICILGQENYHVQQFLQEYSDGLKQPDSLSISILGLARNNF